MKIRLYFSIVLVLICKTCVSQQIQFANIYFNSGYYRVQNLTELNDSSYLICGDSGAGPWSPHTQFLLHIKPDGTILNSHSFFYGFISSTVRLNDSTVSILAQGWNGVNGINLVNVNLNTWDTSGYQLFGNANQGWGIGIYQTPDSGFLLCNNSAGNYNLIKTDKEFNEIWHVPTNYSSNGRLLVDQFNNILVTCYVPNGSSQPYAYCYYDSAGSLLWAREYGNAGSGGCSNCDITGTVITSDSNFLSLTYGYDWQMMKINHGTGDTMWTKQFYEPIYNAVNISPNRHFICTSNHFGVIDDNGDTVYTKPCPINNNFIPVRSIVTKDGGFAICGFWGTGAPQWIQCPVLIKTDSLLNTVFTAVLDPGNNYQPLSIYPNPAQNELWISSSMAGERGVTFTLYDLQGRVTLQQQCDGTEPVDVSAVPTGLYIATLKGKEKEVRGKVVIER